MDRCAFRYVILSRDRGVGGDRSLAFHSTVRLHDGRELVLAKAPVRGSLGSL